jgi:acrylyl-CoA reductase (NADPH)
VAPFILRGVTLAGISSVMMPMDERLAAWRRLERSIDRAKLQRLSREIGLGAAIEASAQVLAGAIRGRMVVNVNQ